MRRAAALAVLLVGLPLAPAAADRVWLVNGGSFDEVVVEETEPAVRIRLPHGTLTLPSEMVERIERSESALATYLERRASLTTRQVAPATEWLSLALWARSRGLEVGSRDAALRAAELEPELEGLAPLMRHLGRVLDREAGIWVEYESPRAAEVATSPEAPATAEESSIAERLARAVEFLAVAEAAEARAAEQRSSAPPAAPAPAPAPSVYGYPSVVAVAGWVIPGPAPARDPAADAARGRALRRELVRRQPGSLLPFPRPGVGGSLFDRRR